MPVDFAAGAIGLTALTDSYGDFFQPVSEAFPAAGADAWQRAETGFPAAFGPDGEWRLAFRGFLVRPQDSTTILVDTGVGPAGSPASSWAPSLGRLPSELAGAGIAPSDVDIVVLTHLHTDHIGWSVVDGTPYFPNARYVVQAADHDAMQADSPELYSALVEPLADQLDLRTGDFRLTDAVRAVLTPGHTAGHQSILVDDGEDTVAITGDAFVHPIQMLDPTVRYLYESDPDTARESRYRLLEEVTILASAHFPEPFTRIR